MFTIPGIDLPIYSYGVMLGLSLVVGWYVVMWLGKKDGLPTEKMSNCFFWTAVAAMIGARVLYIVTNISEFSDGNLLDMLNVRKGGLVAYGGFLGGFVGSWIFLWRNRIRLLPWADVAVPALGSGLGITRFGCLFYGCDYGQPISANAPSWIQSLGIRFPNWNVAYPDLANVKQSALAGPIHGSPAFAHHVHMGLVSADAPLSALVYPTQIMEILNGWIAFGLMLYMRRFTKFRGQVFLFFVIYYGVTRTLMEFLRGDTGRGGVGEVSTSQIIGVGTAVMAAVAWYFLAQQARRDPVAAMALGPGAVEAPAVEPKPAKKARRKSR